MRVAAVEFSYSMLDAIESREQYLDMMQGYIARAVDNEVDLLVFPGFTGCYYQLMEFKGQNLHQTVTGVCHQQFIHSVMELSKEYELLICPGSYWERQGGGCVPCFLSVAIGRDIAQAAAVVSGKMGEGA